MENVSVIQAVSKLECVASIKPWQDRNYLTLTVSSGSRANADLRTKIWIKGNVLTIEEGKGYHSDAWLAQSRALQTSIVAAGGSVVSR